MRFNDLARGLTRREAKKKQVNIAQMSEVLARLVDMIAEDPFKVLGCLLEAASKRKGKK